MTPARRLCLALFLVCAAVAPAGPVLVLDEPVVRVFVGGRRVLAEGVRVDQIIPRLDSARLCLNANLAPRLT